MNFFGNGFLAFHIEVRVKPGYVQAVNTAVAQWQDECRPQSGWPGFPASMLKKIKDIKGVLEISCEGPQSAVLIPLRMIHNLTGSMCKMSTTIGTGPITLAIEKDLASWGIELEPVNCLENADAPLEFSFRDSHGASSSLKLYPAPRRRYQAGIGPRLELPNHLVLNRYNQGLLALAAEVAAGDGIVSFRPRELGRHDSIQDWVSILSHTRHLTISSRHGAMRAFARHENFQTPRGWPEGNAKLIDPVFAKLAAALSKHMQPGAIVLLHRQSVGDTLFFTEGKQPIVIQAPSGYGNESRMARLQGALLALISLRDPENTGTMDSEIWQHLCTDSVTVV